MGKLDGKVALITGGSSGMALATAELFIAEGAFVHITGRRQEALEAAVSRLGPQANGIVADSSDLDDIERVFAGIDRLDVLFASSGATDQRPLLDVTPADFDRLFDVNVRGTLFTAQKAAAHMTSGGAIILNGSVATVMSEPGSSVYSASKAALVAFARVWSVELATLGIRVNVVHPGPINTAIMDRAPREAIDKLVALTASGRVGEPREIADAVLFLAGNDFVTGTELFVTGGMEQAHAR